mgnify:CR=1 FL=1|tara:strand:+ start:8623 stop:9021 length:399 start_codon:yes stop_codon:yes gene_type:complete
MALTAKKTGSGIQKFLNFLGVTGDAGVLVPAQVSFPSPDQDPVFDHAYGTKTPVTVSATILTPPAGCKYACVSSNVDIFVNTAGATAVDDGTSIPVFAFVEKTIPVTAGVAVKALSSSGTATVRVTPLKVRA